MKNVMFPYLLKGTTRTGHMLPTGFIRKWEIHSLSLLGPH